MRTIHIWDELKLSEKQTLLKTLYDKVLKNDDQFHFFYEPELIVRLKEENIPAVEKVLEKRGLGFAIYDYPVGKGKKGNFCYECDQYVLDNLEQFIRIYHANAVLYFKLSDKDKQAHLSRIMHTTANTFGFNYFKEARLYAQMGQFYYELTINSLAAELEKKRKK